MDKRTQSVPIDTGDGDEIVEQQNVGRGVERGGGEFPDPHTPPEPPAPGAAAMPGAPTGAQTLTEVIDGFEAAGHTGQFVPVAGGNLRCTACDRETPADELDVAALRRVEGVSDPDDMAAVAALACPQCGTKGTVALKYGPSATPEEADVLGLVERLNRSA